MPQVDKPCHPQRTGENPRESGPKNALHFRGRCMATVHWPDPQLEVGKITEKAVISRIRRQSSCLKLRLSQNNAPSLSPYQRQGWLYRHEVCVITWSPCSEGPELYLRAKSLQSCPNLCIPMDYSLPSSSVHGILQARIMDLEERWPSNLPNPGIELTSPVSPALQADSLLLSHRGSPTCLTPSLKT